MKDKNGKPVVTGMTVRFDIPAFGKTPPLSGVGVVEFVPFGEGLNLFARLEEGNPPLSVWARAEEMEVVE
jgi:hypothetical protein